MKKFTAFLLLLLLCLCPLAVQTGYAIFSYAKDAAVTATVSGSNAMFDETLNDDYYRVYFFASPYYATGAEFGSATDTNHTEYTDPLKIAELGKDVNPYDVTANYGLVGSKLTGTNTKYANAEFSSGDHHYISYKNKTVDVLTGIEGQLELFERRDYTGYIRANAALGIEKTSTYVAITVRGNLSAEQLDGVVAASEFKDQYGFGPEFIGWTYDKETTKSRTMYGDKRYTTDSTLNVCDSRGWGINETPYQYGNFGCQGEIEQITSTTSLQAIDKTTTDGSKQNDKVIYLYPVFIAKNYSADKSVGGNTTSILKFRVNADKTQADDGSKMYRYEYDQFGEIDYSKNRYTAGFFQRTSDNDVNYYLNNLHIDGKSDFQLDVCPVNGKESWGSYWSTIFSNEGLKKLKLPDGYYNVDVTFLTPIGTATSGAKDKVQQLIEKYKATNHYVSLYSSLDTSPSDGLVLLTKNRQTNDNSISVYFVIGFEKVEEFHFVGGPSQESASDYYASGYQILNNTSQMGENVEYLIPRTYLYQDETYSVLAEYADKAETLPYELAYMDAATISNINNIVNQGEQKAVTFEGAPAVATETPKIAIVKNRLKVNESGNYVFVFAVEYENGQPSKISFAYQRSEFKYSFIVLNEKPTSTSSGYYTSLSGIKDNVYAQTAAEPNEYLTEKTELELVGGTGGTTTLEELLKNYKLIDTATDVELTLELFQSNNFRLNRHYIVYKETRG